MAKDSSEYVLKSLVFLRNRRLLKTHLATVLQAPDRIYLFLNHLLDKITNLIITTAKNQETDLPRRRKKFCKERKNASKY